MEMEEFTYIQSILLNSDGIPMFNVMKKLSISKNVLGKGAKKK